MPGPIKTGYTRCAEEGGVCTFGGIAHIAYGADSSVSCFTYKDYHSSISCDNNSFPDPIIGTHKYCYFKKWKLGDANGDDNVDGKDYFVWMKYYGQSVTGDLPQ